MDIAAPKSAEWEKFGATNKKQQHNNAIQFFMEYFPLFFI
jgi:hypothetical protein